MVDYSQDGEVHISPSNYSIQRAGIEVYDTDEENYQPYVSPSNGKSGDNLKSADVANENSEENVEEEYTGESAYTLHQGEILNTFYYTDLLSLNFESDYKEMTSNGTFTKQDINLSQFYKGIRIKLLSEWEEPDKSITWDDLLSAEEGFITEQTFKPDEIEVKVSGMETLLEQNMAFEFKNMPRGQILFEIIKSAGLNPIINTSGLDDDITSFTNEIKRKNSTTVSNQAIGRSSGKIAQVAQAVCQGKTSALDKAQAIHNFINNHVDYPSPNYSNHRKCPMEVLRSGLSNCCDRARLGHEMANAVGLQNRGVHGPGHVWVQYAIGGKWVDSDPGSSRPTLGSVWKGMSMDSVWTFEEC